MTKQKFGLTGTALKTIALVLMVMDHIHYFFEFTGVVPEWFSMLARLSAPLFLFCTVEGFAQLPDISEGLENRLAAAVQGAGTLDELVQAMRTKRYATARLRRLVLDAALGYTGDLPALPPYLHVLGANETGLAVLRCARQAALLPLSHSLADLAARSAPAARVAAAHAAAEDLTALCLRHPAPMGAAYTAKPVFPTSGAK